MRRGWRYLWFVALAAFPGAARAGFYSGKDLLAACAVEKGDPAYFERNYECVAYVAGAVDAFNTTRAANGLKSCLPPKVTIRQLRDVTVDYLRDNAKKQSAPASTLVFSATRKAWPCDAKKARKKRK